ncbi:MAG: tetratricopeptide repeat protein [Planctomycetaceae bacterium]|nr:tetratricopeptide repeat protein [Planctomycetaceae bacterium]
MLRISPYCFVLTLAVLIFATGSGRAEDEVRELNPVEEAIVVSQETKLMRGDEAAGGVQPGQLLIFSKAKGEWRYSAEFRGWVNLRDVIPLNKAVAYFSEIIQKEKTPAAYHHRGIAHAVLGNWNESLADLNEAIKLGEASSFAFFNRALAERALDQRDEAIKDFTQSITLNPNNVRALLERGDMLLEDGHNEAAMKDYDAAVEAAPDSAAAHNHRGVGLRMLGRYEEAEAEYTKAIKIAPKYSEAFANRAYVYCGLGKYKAACADYEQALEFQPDVAEYQNDFAWLLATSPEKDLLDGKRAVQLAESACKQFPEDPDFLDTLAAAHARNGQFDEAVKIAVKALKLLGQTEDGLGIHERMELYEKKQAYTEVEE